VSPGPTAPPPTALTPQTTCLSAQILILCPPQADSVGRHAAFNGERRWRGARRTAVCPEGSRGTPAVPRRVPTPARPYPGALEPFRGELLRIELRYQDSAAFIVVASAFHTTGAERFVASVIDALETQPEAIVVDANGLTFIGSSGLAALLRSRAAAGVAGVGFRISKRSPALRRAIDAAGIEDLLADE
jgi:anti-anti-sigma factor